MKSPIFSIITINYNNLRGLKKTVASVLAQNMQNFEYIIIDGASQDGSVDYVNSFASPSILIISEKDNGIYDAMNKGIKLSKGDYLVFMNSGDFFANENVLNRIYLHLKNSNNEYDFIYGDAYEEVVGSNEIILKKSKSHLLYWYGMFGHHQSMFFLNKSIKNYKMTYNEKYSISADWDFVIRFLKYAENYARILRVNFPISVFETGGISGDYRKGIKEQYRIRRETLSWGHLRCSLISVLHFSLNNIRLKMPYLYKIYHLIRAKTLKRYAK